MRIPRIKEPDGGYYHVMSRIVDRRRVLDRNEKERFRTLLWKVGAFSGVQLLTYAILDDHFHLLLHVPAPRPITDAEFGERLSALYDGIMVSNLMTHLGQLRADGQTGAAERLKAQYTHRMHDLSEFDKTLKQRFSQSYNARHRRRGTLWEERFKSILVQDSQGALSAIAAYIDLNPVRAGIVSDPRDYRFCGYGEAIGGSRQARQGLAGVMLSLGRDGAWQQIQALYRQFLYVTGEESGVDDVGRPLRRGFTRAELQQVIDAGGQLTRHQALRCRIRYFNDGLVLGSRAYVDDAFRRYRNRFSPKRSSGARPIRGAQMDGLCTARRLRLHPITLATV